MASRKSQPSIRVEQPADGQGWWHTGTDIPLLYRPGMGAMPSYTLPAGGTWGGSPRRGGTTGIPSPIPTADRTPTPTPRPAAPLPAPVQNTGGPPAGMMTKDMLRGMPAMGRGTSVPVWDPSEGGVVFMKPDGSGNWIRDIGAVGRPSSGRNDGSSGLGGGRSGGQGWGGTNVDARTAVNARGGYKKGGRVKGKGTGRSDSVKASVDGKAPARLSRDEYVIPADVVAAMGEGSSEAGAEQLDRMVMGVRKQHIDTLAMLPPPSKGEGGKFLGGLFGDQQQEVKQNVEPPRWLSKLTGPFENGTLTAFGMDPAQAVAGFSPDTLASFDATRQIALDDPTNYFGSAKNAQGLVSEGIRSFRNAGKDFTTAEATQRMNPYNDIVLQNTLRDFDRNAAIQTNNTAMQRAGREAFGIRRDLAENEENRAINEERGDLSGKLRQQGFESARDQFNIDQGRTRQVGQDLLTAAGDRMGIAGQTRGTALDNATRLAGVGAQYEGKQQQYLDSPWTQVDRLNRVFSGAPMGSTQSTNGGGASPLSQLGGLGLLAAGYYFANGGRVDFTDDDEDLQVMLADGGSVPAATGQAAEVVKMLRAGQMQPQLAAVVYRNVTGRDLAADYPDLAGPVKPEPKRTTAAQDSGAVEGPIPARAADVPPADDGLSGPYGGWGVYRPETPTMLPDPAGDNRNALTMAGQAIKGSIKDNRGQVFADALPPPAQMPAGGAPAPAASDPVYGPQGDAERGLLGHYVDASKARALQLWNQFTNAGTPAAGAADMPETLASGDPTGNERMLPPPAAAAPQPAPALPPPAPVAAAAPAAPAPRGGGPIALPAPGARPAAPAGTSAGQPQPFGLFDRIMAELDGPTAGAVAAPAAGSEGVDPLEAAGLGPPTGVEKWLSSPLTLAGLGMIASKQSNPIAAAAEGLGSAAGVIGQQRAQQRQLYRETRQDERDRRRDAADARKFEQEQRLAVAKLQGEEAYRQELLRQREEDRAQRAADAAEGRALRADLAGRNNGNQRQTPEERMTNAMIDNLAKQIGDVQVALMDPYADPETKAQLQQQLGTLQQQMAGYAYGQAPAIPAGFQPAP